MTDERIKELETQLQNAQEKIKGLANCCIKIHNWYAKWLIEKDCRCSEITVPLALWEAVEAYQASLKGGE